MLNYLLQTPGSQYIGHLNPRVEPIVQPHKNIADTLSGKSGNLGPNKFNFDPNKKASFVEKIKTKITGRTSIDRLRPNPVDEYSTIGPSDNQISYHRHT